MKRRHLSTVIKVVLILTAGVVAGVFLAWARSDLYRRSLIDRVRTAALFVEAVSLSQLSGTEAMLIARSIKFWRSAYRGSLTVKVVPAFLLLVTRSVPLKSCSAICLAMKSPMPMPCFLVE